MALTYCGVVYNPLTKIVVKEIISDEGPIHPSHCDTGCLMVTNSLPVTIDQASTASLLTQYGLSMPAITPVAS